MKHKRFISIIITLAAIMFTVSVQASPLHDAVEAGDLEKVKAAIAAGYDVNEIDKSNERSLRHGTTPLQRAALKGNFEMVKYLVEHGANVNGRSIDGFLTLRYSDDYKSISPYLLQHGADINAKDSDGKTILHACSSVHNIKGIEYLLSHGADVNAKDSDGKTPLHYVASSPYNTFLDINKEMSQGETTDWTTSEETIRLLLDAGADIKARDNKGQTSLHYAANSSNVNVTKYLLKKGASVDTRDNDGNTPLLSVFIKMKAKGWYKEVLAIVQLLSARGANMKTVNNNGDNALHLLAKSDLSWHYCDVAKYLMSRGVDPSVSNKNGLTALDLAERMENHVEFLKTFKGK
jgi:ankyrin repeat protein